ncbi:MAG: ribose-phosphate pyrophosphokinase [Candidatus Omnitrophica bacterium]|nr:ribose-phosphate pyrophosphokinase [Candidatus Omnitrophota bacterium]
MRKDGKLLLVSGNANRPLAEEIAKYLSTRLCDAKVDVFMEGEVHVQILDDVRGCDVFVIQPTCPPPNRNLMELLILIDALRRASAGRITAVLPFYGYARQDRKDRPRVPITAKLVANLITGAGANRVLTMDLHAGQIQGFFDIPLDHLYAINVFVDYFDRKNLQDRVVVAPDVGSIKMARAYSKRLKADLAVVDKRRVDAKETVVMNILGDVKDKNVIMVDDVISSAGSICEAAKAVKNAGAKTVIAAVSHAILCGPAMERIEQAPLDELCVTNSIPVGEDKRRPKVKVVTVAPLLGEAIRRIHNSESVSGLFGSIVI